MLRPFWCLWECVEHNPVGMVERVRILVPVTLNVCVTQDSQDHFVRKILIHVLRHHVCTVESALKPRLVTTHATVLQGCPVSVAIMDVFVRQTPAEMVESAKRATMDHYVCAEVTPD